MVFLGSVSAVRTSTDREGSRSQPVGRNDRCPCGSGNKYKKCCLLQMRRETASSLPPWMINSSRKLYQFEKYATSVYGLPSLLGSFCDGRHDPVYPTLEVVDALFHAALLRRPSINATEGDLKQADCRKNKGPFLLFREHAPCS